MNFYQMIRTLKKIFSLLSSSQRFGLLRMQLLLLFMAIFEVVSLISIIPFMALVGNSEILSEPGLLNELFQYSQVAEANTFLIFLAGSVLLIILTSSLFSMYCTWRLAMFGNRVGADLSNRLFTFYMQQSWPFHANGNSTNLITKIAHEGHRLTYSVINPLLNLNAKFISILFIATALFIFNPVFALMGILVFGMAYYLIFNLAKFYLDRNGKNLSKDTQLRFRLMSEGFGGIKESLLLGRQPIFTKRFSEVSNNIAYSMGNNQTLTNVPRYFIELVVLSAIIILILFLLINNHQNIITTISVYALAALKLLPGFQQVYTSTSVIRANLAAFEALEEDLIASQSTNLATNNINIKNAKIQFSDTISFHSVSFAYQRQSSKVLDNLNLIINKNTSVGIVGHSGSGKSTLVDLLLGLLEPSEGKILIDNKMLNNSNMRSWQNRLGYVSQSIYLADTSIKENIAFGLPLSDIDDEMIERSMTLAQLTDFVASLPDGHNTLVGERGVQLSGGQRQRIGIARALYADADVLILDEATSSLDGLTEKAIMDSVNNFAGKKTIIMIAHRLATVRECDLICLVDNGKIIDYGTFDELIERNKMFSEMAKNA